MKIKRIVSLFIICLVASFCALFGACTSKTNDSGSNDDSNQQQVIAGVINKTQLALEKHETYQLKVAGNDTFEWSSTDPAVATVGIDGTVTALSEGMTIIKAISETTEAKCIVQVTDNELVPKIVTNIGESELSLIKDDSFSFEYNVYYNQKLIDVDIDISIEGNDNVIMLEGNRIIAQNYGSSSIILSGEWSGISILEVIEIHVIADMVASVLDVETVTLYNDERAGETSLLMKKI